MRYPVFMMYVQPWECLTCWCTASLRFLWFLAVTLHSSPFQYLLVKCANIKSWLSGSILVSSCFFVLLARVSYGCRIVTLWASLHMWNLLCSRYARCARRFWSCGVGPACFAQLFWPMRSTPPTDLQGQSCLSQRRSCKVDLESPVLSHPNLGCSNRFGLRLGATSNEWLRGTTPQVHPGKQKVHIHACTWDSCTKLDSSF